jgi:hypothetical protein
MEDNYELFLNNLKIYYDLISKPLNNENTDIILSNSFIFSNDMKNFKILNSISEIIRQDLPCDSLLFNYFKKIFISYQDKCPDFSNLFLILTYEILVDLKCQNKRHYVGRELGLYRNFILNLVRDNMYLKVK